MSLREKIDQYKEKSAGKASPEMVAVMSAATAGVQDSIASRKIPKTGEKFPNFVLPDSHGNSVNSNTLLQSGPLVVTFFRECGDLTANLELDALNEVISQFKSLSTTLVAVTPQLTETNRKLVSSRKLEFEVLYDENNQFADRLDLKHGFPNDLKEVYGKFGIDVAAANGTSGWELPIPARFVVDPSGIVRSAEFDADYTTRPEPTATLEVLRALG